MEIFKTIANKIDSNVDSRFVLYRIEYFINRHKRKIIDGFAIVLLAITILVTTIVVFG